MKAPPRLAATDPPLTPNTSLEGQTSWLAHRTAAVLVALAAGLQITFWAWGAWPQRPPTPDELQSLTLLGQAWYRPDHDLPVYLGGIALSLVLALVFGAAWSHRLARVDSSAGMQRLHRVLLWHLPVALMLAALPAGRMNLAAGSAALLFGAAALWYTRTPPGAKPGVLPLLPHALAAWRPHPIWVATGQVAIAALIVLIVYIPDPWPLVRLADRLDHFHHIDFYMMAPALAFRHGLALGTSFYTQYGVGWPLLLATLSKTIAPLSYGLLVTLCVTWGCVYFFVLHTFLRVLLRSWAWATTGLFLVLLLQLFSGAEALPKWLWPSSTVLRYSMDMLLFLCCLTHARTGRPWLALPIGAVAAAAMLLGTDTGLYLLVCMGGHLLGVARLQAFPHAPFKPGRFAACTLLSFVVVLLAGLAIASRGTLWTAAFWVGWTESLRIYNHGFAHLPMSEALNRHAATSLLLMLMLMCYLFALSRMADQAWRRALTPNHLIMGLVALNGLATLLLFIGRSHPFNMTHVSVPFCVLLTNYAAEAVNSARQGLAGSWPAAVHWRLQMALRVLPWACALLAFAAMCAHPAFRNYPNTIAALGSRGTDAARGRWSDNDDTRRDRMRFDQVTAALRRLSGTCHGNLAMVDGADTPYLVQVDLRPHFRYSPVLANLAFKSQLEFTRQQIINDPPECIVLPLDAPMATIGVRMADTHQGILDVVQRLYKLDDTVGAMAVYRLGAHDHPTAGSSRQP